MTTQTNADTTTVTQVDLEALDLLNMGGAGNIITQTPEPAKTTVFTKKDDDMSFIDNEDPDKDSDKNPDGTPKTPSAEEILTSVTNDDNLSPEEKEELAKKEAGRPKQSKEVMISVVNKLIEKGRIIPFDDEKKLEDYTANDLEELIEANFNESERKIKEQTPLEFFDSLPQELQYAAKYVQDGGRNLKALFKTLAQVEENRELDVNTPEGQKQIIRNYLTASTKLSPEDIQEEIASWEDRNELEAKASKFKPKLDALNEEQITQTLQAQEVARKKQIEQSNKYMENIYNVLAPAELNGIKLDKKTQSMLYAGLVQPSYPSIRGNQTNLLGHLLEKYQFVEPNHALIAEALWLLQDPESYREKVKEVAKKATVESTVRTLKSEESRKSGSGTGTNDDDDTQRAAGGAKKPTLKRPTNTMFKREF
jgi:hypothetical protein